MYNPRDFPLSDALPEPDPPPDARKNNQAKSTQARREKALDDFRGKAKKLHGLLGELRAMTENFKL
jgi:hypothetical protein